MESNDNIDVEPQSHQKRSSHQIEDKSNKKIKIEEVLGSDLSLPGSDLDPFCVSVNGKITKEEAKKQKQRLKDEKREKKEKEKKEREEKRRKKALQQDLEKKEKNEKKEREKEKKEKKENSQLKLSGFFTPLKKKSVVKGSALELGFDFHFTPFTPKKGTWVAPVNRWAKHVDDDEYLALLNTDQSLSLPFKEWLRNSKRPLASPTIPNAGLENEKNTFPSWKYDPSPSRNPFLPKKLVGIVDPKDWRFLKFAQDVRPAYFGSWTKKSNIISGRRPLRKDESVFDYDFDSEAEWEEDEPGEELVSEAEEEEDPVGEDEEEQGWLVPHGYLSDDEGQVDDDEPITRSKPSELKIKTVVDLTPILIGPSLSAMEVMPGLLVEKMQVDIVDPFEELELKDRCERRLSRKSTFPSELLPELTKFIEQSPCGLNLSKLVEEAQSILPGELTKTCLEAEIKRQAVRERTDGSSKWYIKGTQPSLQLQNDSEFVGPVELSGTPSRRESYRANLAKVDYFESDEDE